MDLLNGHLRDRLFNDQDTNGPVFIKDDTLYEHPLFNIKYTSYHLQQEQDTIHLKYGSEGIMVHSPTTPGPEPWLYACVVAVYHVLVYTEADPMAKRVDTGGEVSWKPVGTSWVNCRLWITFPPMYPPITFGAHLECNLNI